MTTDAAGLPVNVVRNIAVSPDLVFDAWVNPDVMKEWLFKSSTNEIQSIEVDLRVGGSYSILELNNGREIHHFGTYARVERPTALSFSLQVPEHFPETTHVTVDITTNGGGSILRFNQSGIDKETVEKFWLDMLDALEKLLEGTVKD